MPDIYSARAKRKLGDSKTGAGATKETERAVEEGLLWLARHQSGDGGWKYAELKAICDAGQPCTKGNQSVSKFFDTGLTGLAILAFLGAGHGPDSTSTLGGNLEGGRTAGEVVSKAVDWLLANQHPSGHFALVGEAFMYNEALATWALAEAHAMAAERVPAQKLQAAVDFLVGAQRPNPSGNGSWGWRYYSLQDARKRLGSAGERAESRALIFDSDTSATAWCLQALAHARLSGVSVPNSSIEGALSFIQYATSDNGMVGYVDPKQAGQAVLGPGDHFTYHTGTLSAMAMLGRCHAVQDVKNPFFPLASSQLVRDLPAVGTIDGKTKDRLGVDYYYWYHGTSALAQIDGPTVPNASGKYWSPWFKAVTAALLQLQLESMAATGAESLRLSACRRGGWLVPDRWGSTSGGPIYQTAIAVLTLEAPYRHKSMLPIVKKK